MSARRRVAQRIEASETSNARRWAQDVRCLSRWQTLTVVTNRTTLTWLPNCLKLATCDGEGHRIRLTGVRRDELTCSSAGPRQVGDAAEAGVALEQGSFSLSPSLSLQHSLTHSNYSYHITPAMSTPNKDYSAVKQDILNVLKQP